MTAAGRAASAHAGRGFEHAFWLVFTAAGLVLAAAPFFAIERLAASARGAFSSELAAEFGTRAWLGAALCLSFAIGMFAARRQLLAFVVEVARSWPAARSTAVAALRTAFVPRGVFEVVMFASIAVTAIVLRLAFLQQPVRNDEAITVVEFASQPLWVALSYYPAPNNHLFHTLLVWLAHGALGDDVWAVRLPAVLAGVLLVPATLLAGAALYGRTAGLIGAALVASSSILVEYSTNARGYTLLALIFVVGLGALPYIARTANAAAVLGLVTLGALGFWTMPTMVYALAVWLAVLALLGGHGALAKHGIAGGLLLGGAVLLLYLPAVLVSGPERLVANSWVLPLPFDRLLPALGQSLVETLRDWHRDLAWPIVLVLVAGVVLSHAQRRQNRVSLVLAALIACAPIVLVQRVAPFERVWLFLLPAYFLQAAAGLGVLLARARAELAPIAATALALTMGWHSLTSASILQSDETGAFPQAEAVTRTVASLIGPEVVVQTCVRASQPQLQYHFRRLGLDTQALVRPSSEARQLLIVARGDTSACTPDVQGSRTIEWSAWQQVRVVDEIDGASVLLFARMR